MRKQISLTEAQECITLVKWANTQKKLQGRLIHIPNEGKRSKIGGRLLKLMGLVPGCSDYFLAVPTEHYHGLFLEMKRSDKSKTTVSDTQLSFIDQQRKNGYYSTVCYGALEAIKLIEQYVNNWKFN